MTERTTLIVSAVSAQFAIAPLRARTARRMRRIEYVKVGRLTRFPVAALDRYISANRYGRPRYHQPKESRPPCLLRRTGLSCGQ